MAPQNPILTINNLYLNFNTTDGVKNILKGVDLSIERNESFALVGESGSGKSVTAQAILQLLGSHSTISEGSISFEGEFIHTKTSKEMQLIRGKKIGMVFQNPMTSFNPTMQIGHQLTEALISRDRFTVKQAKNRAVETLGLVGITDPAIRMKAYPFQLSGGMLQRVMIAMALVAEPVLLIADEPTTALDVTVQAQILDLLTKIRMQTGMTLLLITHNLGIVAEHCSRAAIMKQGVIVETNRVEDIFSTPQHPYTKLLLANR